MFALRGAVPVTANEKEAIESASARLVRELIARNGLAPSRIVSIVFTATPDLDQAFPAAGARREGLDDIPTLCAVEIDVPGAPPRIVRVLMQVDGTPSSPVEHVYLDSAAALRPDRVRKDGGR